MNYRKFFWLNLSCLLIVLIIVAATALSGASVSQLFLHPFFNPSPSVALFTRTFQTLCSVPFVVCAFTYSLLRIIKPSKEENKFILFSAVLTGGFLLNEIYRIHLFLGGLGIPKIITICFYATLVIWYGLTFRKRLLATPYGILLAGTSLLFFGITIDSLHLSGDAFPSLLEGIPKLFSEINISLYYWLVCSNLIQNMFKTSRENSSML